MGFKVVFEEVDQKDSDFDNSLTMLTTIFHRNEDKIKTETSTSRLNPENSIEVAVK